MNKILLEHQSINRLLIYRWNAFIS